MPIEDYDPIGNALQKTATAGAAVQTQAVNWLYRTMDSVGSLSFTKRFMQNRRNSAIASFSAIGMFIVVISIIKDFDKHLGEDSPVTALIALIGFSFLFIAPLLAAGAWVGCPNCHRTWARLYQTRRHLESTSGAALVDRTDVHKNAKNETIGTSDRTEQVAVVRSTYRYFWKCRFCAHQWATLRNFVSQEW